jgi:hypothetical protein
MRRGVIWLTVLAAIAAHLAIGPTLLAAVNPPNPDCPCV